jgi:hypothetical protein
MERFRSYLLESFKIFLVRLQSTHNAINIICSLTQILDILINS